MKFGDVRMKRVSGCLPDFGAIFMSNRSTKDECFNRKLFGLPLALADFVKNVKAGMILFLFEYEQRRLYGVFEAVSDGAIDTVPHAYRSSGKFPAQVQFSIVWRCRPLSECDFRDAIKDNYYASNKFTFGLSKEQVCRLLWLFYSRKAKVSQSVSVHEEIEHVNISSSSAYLGLEDYIPLCSPEHSDPVIEARSDNSPMVKGLYSDSREKRANVFSRLDLVPKAAAEENYDNSTVDEVMKKLQQRHDNWGKTEGVARNNLHGNRESYLKRRASVFSRLNYTLEGTEQEKEINTKVDEYKIKEKFRGSNKRGRILSITNYGDDQNSRMTVQVVKGEMLKMQCENEIRDCNYGLQNKKRRWNQWLTNESSDVKTSVCDSFLKVPMSSDGSSASKENCGGGEGSVRSERGVVASERWSMTCEESSGEKDNGLTNKDSELGARDSCLTVAAPTPLKTYQRRRLSASPCVTDPNEKFSVNGGKCRSVVGKMQECGEEKTDCCKALSDADEGEECSEENAEEELQFFL